MHGPVPPFSLRADFEKNLRQCECPLFLFVGSRSKLFNLVFSSVKGKALLHREVVSTKVTHGKAQVGLRECGKQQLLRSPQPQGRLFATSPEQTQTSECQSRALATFAANSLGRLRELPCYAPHVLVWHVLCCTWKTFRFIGQAEREKPNSNGF